MPFLPLVSLLLRIARAQIRTYTGRIVMIAVNREDGRADVNVGIFVVDMVEYAWPH